MTDRFKGLLFVLLLLSGCGRSTPLNPDDILAVRIVPVDPSLYLNQVVQLTVEGHYVDGTVRDLTTHPEVIFRLNTNGVIEVLAEGKILGLTPGSVRLFAAFGGRENYIDITVHDASLEAIEIKPSVLEMDPGDYLQLEVLGILSDGSQLDLTRAATGTKYSSDDLTVASATEDGLVFAQEEGQTTIRVEQGEFTEFVPVTVGEPAVLTGIGASPSSVNINLGETLQLEVFGYYEDGSVANLTRHRNTEFASSDQAVATVSDTGQVSAAGQGNCDITITHLEFSTLVTVRVSDESPVDHVTIDPPAAVLPLDGTIQLTVIAVYTDGSQEDVTNRAE